MVKLNERLSNKVFKVVKITDLEGNDKSYFTTQTRVFEKVVRVYSLYEGSTAILIPEDDRAIHTSMVESVSITQSSDLPIRLIIETLNTVYYLDEYLPKVKSNVDELFKKEYLCEWVREEKPKVYPKQPVFTGYSREDKEWHTGFGWFDADFTDDYLEEKGLPPQAVLMTDSSSVVCDLESMRQIFEGDD